MVYLLGINIPILEMLVVFSVIVVVYLIILEIEFRQIRRIVRRFAEGEAEFRKEEDKFKKDNILLGNHVKEIKATCKECKKEHARLRDIINNLHKASTSSTAGKDQQSISE